MKKYELIKILLDPTSRDDEKDDAAIGLGQFNEDEEVESVLIKVANDFSFNEMIRGSCGESLAEIWLKKPEIEWDKLKLLNGIALQEAMELIKAKRKN